MGWQDSMTMFMNQNEFMRVIIIIALILIIYKATVSPQSIIQSILLAIFGVLGIWIFMNIDYIFYLLVH